MSVAVSAAGARGLGRAERWRIAGALSLLLALDGVAAVAAEDADDTAAAPQPEPLFALILDGHHRGGSFTGLADVPGGLVVVQEHFTSSDRMPPGTNLAASYILDPALPGGDTLILSENGVVSGELDGGRWSGTTFWSLSGSGEYADVKGRGRAFIVVAEDDDYIVNTFVGVLGD